jgi:hypothetical protein
MTRLPGRPHAKNTSWEEDYSFHQGKHPAYGDPDDPEGQQEQPNDGVEQQSGNGHRPAEHEQ